MNTERKTDKSTKKYDIDFYLDKKNIKVINTNNQNIEELNQQINNDFHTQIYYLHVLFTLCVLRKGKKKHT